MKKVIIALIISLLANIIFVIVFPLVVDYKGYTSYDTDYYGNPLPGMFLCQSFEDAHFSHCTFNIYLALTILDLVFVIGGTYGMSFILPFLLILWIIFQWRKNSEKIITNNNVQL